MVYFSSLVASRNIEDMKFKDIRKDLINYLKPQERLVVAERTGFLQMSQGWEEAPTNYPARLREAARYCKFVNLKASLDPEAEMFQLHFFAGLQDSEAKLQLLEALRQNDNLTVEELPQLIQNRTQAKRVAESSVHQSTSSVVAYAEIRGLKNKNLSRRQKPEQGGRCGRTNSLHFMKALLRMKSVTIVRSKDTTHECAKLKNNKHCEFRGKSIGNQIHQCTIHVKNKNSRIPPHPKKPCIMESKSQM